MPTIYSEGYLAIWEMWGKFSAKLHILVIHCEVDGAVAIDCLGAWLGQHRLPTVPRGYEGLHSWASGLGEVVAFGIEGTGSYGAGLARYLAGRGRTIIEVNRPERSTPISPYFPFRLIV